MLNQLALQDLLNAKLKKAKARNAAYSLRAFAKHLELGAGALSQILSGKRQVSEAMALQLMDRLGVGLGERAQIFVSKVSESLSSEPEEHSEEAHQLSEDHFKMVADWYHYAILSLMLVKGFKNNPEWISKRLGISENQVKDALLRMKRLEIITEGQNGRLVLVKRKLKSSDNVPSESATYANIQTLELAQKALLKHTVDERDFIHLTVPTNVARLHAAKIFLRKVQSQLCTILMDTTDKTEVYRLSFALFPLTHLATETKK